MWFNIIILVLLASVLVVLILLLKKIQSIKSPNVIVKNNPVKEGFKEAIRELKEEEKQEEDLLKSLDRNKQGMGVFSAVPEEKPIKTDGSLIPYNLSEGEKEILRMFYDQ